MVGGRDRAEDLESFSWFFAAEYPAVVRSLCHLVSREDAEDLAQEAFIRLHTRWTKISRYERPDAWVRRVGINLAITHAKRERRRSPRETRAEQLKVATGDESGQHPEVIAAVQCLPPRDRALVVLFYLEDRPLAEIAEILDISVGAAKVALHRSRARLGQLLQEEVRDEPW